ncbi:MAG: exodeoxyribonuclease VII large subunit [Verrucomicrobiota bacterium]|nr:exodeoxyribonuclease VII large subunit [Verrucomicrobiota bacterium]
MSEITRAVRAAIENQLGVVWVQGEVSNCRKQGSGHQYFTLKDEHSQLACVLFARPGMWRKQVALSDGMHVQVRGALTVYEARGQYQLNVQLVQPAGAGLLQARFEALKRKLDAEGLFDPGRKRALPKFPAAVGVITSPTGAAVRDMLNIFTRRAPWVRVVLRSVRVQGDGAAEEIVAALEEMNWLAQSGLPPVEVIIVARGGGSAEDLWEFNEEVLARAIAASTLPVVSAVGHEIDFTIADFVADLRAPTPSAAAELVVPDTAEILRRLGLIEGQLHRCLAVKVEQHRKRLAFLARSAIFRQPQSRLAEAMQRVDWALDGLLRAARDGPRRLHQRLAELFAAIRQHRPDHLLAIRRQRLDTVRVRLAERLRNAIEMRRQGVRRAEDQLRLLSPLATLHRGYSITRGEDGKILTSVAEASAGRRLWTRLADGEVKSTVDDQEPA